MRSSLFWIVRLGRRLPTFQDNISVFPSGVKQSQENSSATTGPSRIRPTYQRSATSKKTEGLNYTAEKAGNIAATRIIVMHLS